MLQRINAEEQALQGIVLSPTRELAQQNQNVICELGQYMDVKVVLVSPGGCSDHEAANAQIISGTPGRVLELCKQRKLDFKNCKIFVLDEADAMVVEQGLGVQVS
jgi:ATP-dependent RNA helicase